MNAIEDRLRDAFRADADMIGPESVRAPESLRASWSDDPAVRSGRRGLLRRHRFRRTGIGAGARPRELALPLAAAAGVTVVVVLAVILVPRALRTPQQAPGPVHHVGAGRGRSAAPSRPQGSNPGTPYPAFFVAAVDESLLEVRSAKTGALAAEVRAPAGVTFTSVATGDSGTFIAAGWKGSGCRTLLYQFRLSAAGRTGPLKPFAGGSVPGNLSSNLAVSANDRVLAYASATCGGTPGPSVLRVLQLATGQTTQWTFPHQQVVAAVSLSADGRRLAYNVSRPFPSFAAVVPTSAPSGPLAARSRVVAQARQWGAATEIDSAVLDPDGRTLSLVTNLTGEAAIRHWSMRLRRVDVATGVQMHAQRFSGVALGVWGDPAGGWLIVQSDLSASFATPQLRRVDLRSGTAQRLAGGWIIQGDQAPMIAW
jgi:hypothetical protein